jgi:hypothetical protein
VRNFEADRSTPTTNNLTAIQRALEAAGAEFLPDNGVRLKAQKPRRAAIPLPMLIVEPRQP